MNFKSDLKLNFKLDVSILKIKKLNELAIIPTKGTQSAAGYDLYSSEVKTVPAKGKELIKTSISIAVPQGNYGRIAPRSGLAWKNFIGTGAGVIDCDYRGELMVLLFNHSDTNFDIKHGDRIAQLIIEKITETVIEECDDLDSTNRGNGGFGSTGVSIKESEVKKEFDNLVSI